MGVIKLNISCIEILAILITITAGTLKPADARFLRGFDCTRQNGGVPSPISRIEMDKCAINIKDDDVKTYTRKIALLRLNDHQSTYYSLMFKGNATEFVSDKEAAISVNVNDSNYTFSIIGEPQESCGVLLFKTCHPRIFMVELEDLDLLSNKGIVSLKEDTEIFQYPDFKSVLVTKSLERQRESLIRKMMQRKCKREKEILENTVALIFTQPDQFALRYMQAPGFMAFLAGEVIYIVECMQVVVQDRHTDKCYNRLPITSGNRSLFLTPVTHIITEYATEIPCVKPLREQYKLDGVWIGLVPHPTVVLSPEDQMSLPFKKPEKLEQKELQEMRNRTMFPIDHVAIQETMIKQIMNGMKSDSIEDLLDENVMRELAEDMWSRSWGKFIAFSSTCAGLIGIFVFVITILKIIDILIWTWTLYSTFGFSVHILAAFWDTLARIIILKGTDRGNRI